MTEPNTPIDGELICANCGYARKLHAFVDDGGPQGVTGLRAVICPTAMFRMPLPDPPKDLK
jgi:hypothetical protein